MSQTWTRMETMTSCPSSTQSATLPLWKLRELVRCSARCWGLLLAAQSGSGVSNTLNLHDLVRASTEVENLRKMLASLLEEQLPEEM